MAQNSEVVLPEIRFTRTDFTALRAFLNRMPIAQIADLYYTDYERERIGCETMEDLRQRIEDMRERLIYSLSVVNPGLSDILRNARRSGVWSPKLIDFLVKAADSDISTPKKQDPLSAWFKPRLAAVFRGEDIRTLADLMSLIEVSGSSWWKPIPLIGPGKAASIESWLEKYANSLGAVKKSNLPVLQGEIIMLTPDNPVMIPLERMGLPDDYSGANGANRNERFCLISARNDWEAIDCYLYKYRRQEKTRRAYQKELERFLLWCIYERRIALSSVLLDECEAYKDFLAEVPAHWIGRKQPRTSEGWRPFAGQLSSVSQKYAVQVLRSFFDWLVNVRYLLGNPWVTVSDPAVATPLHKMKIEKALPDQLWEKLSQEGGILDILCNTQDAELVSRYKLRGSMINLSMSAQFRLVRAALLLMGDSGLRRAELAAATRDKLKPVPGSHLWEMDVLGKRNKWRTVYPPQRAIEAVAAHWRDRGLDFKFGMLQIPLLSPLNVPETTRGISKHLNAAGELTDQGFSVDGINKIVKAALKRIAEDESIDLEDWERQHLRQSAPHAFRHTFGTQAVTGDVPLDVVQKVLGHASLQTTTIYVQAEKQRSITQLGGFFERKKIEENSVSSRDTS